jgi:CheY-like chemotaxis protein
MNGNTEPPARRLSILVADDNDGIRMSFVAVLRALGHNADAVRDGREAVEATSRKRYDVVFMDLEMPGMDGWQAATALHENHGSDCPWIVAHSGGAEDREHLADFGMDDFVAKPADLDDLRRVMRRLDCALSA